MQITSSIVGTVWQVCAQIGERVGAGDQVVVLESMKMEIPLEAPADGEVAELHVQPGDLVQEGQLVAVLRPV